MGNKKTRKKKGRKKKKNRIKKKTEYKNNDMAINYANILHINSCKFSLYTKTHLLLKLLPFSVFFFFSFFLI